MIRIEETLTTDQPLEAVYNYVAEFAHIAQWDPGVVSSIKRQPGPLRQGDLYDITVRFGLRRIPMVYEALTVEPNKRVILRGESSTSVATDDILFETTPTGQTRLRWRADLSLLGVGAAAEPLFKPLFVRLGKKTIKALGGRLRQGLNTAQSAATRSGVAP